MILGTDSRKPWNDMDLLLAEAYQILEDEKCAQCGLPKYICHSDDEGVQFDVYVDTCEAKKAIHRYEKAHGGKDGYQAPPGTQLGLRPFMVDKERDFTELREPYYRSEMERFADEA